MECTICNNSYDENEHKPYSLTPCGHSFCKRCIGSLANRFCPNCRNSIESTTINYAILDILKEPTRPVSSSTSRDSKIFQSLENVLSEMDELKKSLDESFENKLSECRMSIDNIKQKIQKDTEYKIISIRNDNAQLMSELDRVYLESEKKLKDLSQVQQIKTDLQQFERDFSGLSLDMLSRNSNNLKRNVKQRVENLKHFELNVSLELDPKPEKNQIGRVIWQPLERPRIYEPFLSSNKQRKSFVSLGPFTSLE